MELAWKLLMVERCNENVAALMGTIAWRMWGNWNEIRNGGKRLGEMELCCDAQGRLDALRGLRQKMN